MNKDVRKAKNTVSKGPEVGIHLGYLRSSRKTSMAGAENRRE